MTSTSNGLSITTPGNTYPYSSTIYDTGSYAFANASALFDGVGWLGFKDLYGCHGLVKVNITDGGESIDFDNYFHDIGIDLIEYSTSTDYNLGNTGNYLVVTSGNRIWYSTDNDTWTEITCQTSCVHWTAISVTSHGHLLAVGNKTINLIHLPCNSLHSLNYIEPDKWTTCSISEDYEYYTTITVASANSMYQTQSYYCDLYNTYWYKYVVNGEIINKVVNIVYDTFILTNNFVYLLDIGSLGSSGNLIKYGIRGDNKLEFFDWYNGMFHFNSNYYGYGHQEFGMYYDDMFNSINGFPFGSVIVSDSTVTFTLKNRTGTSSLNICNVDPYLPNGTLYTIPSYIYGPMTKFNNKFKKEITYKKESSNHTTGAWNRPVTFVKRSNRK
jgi:hypothetical protein